jgi:hypothetical protein
MDDIELTEVKIQELDRREPEPSVPWGEVKQPFRES